MMILSYLESKQGYSGKRFLKYQNSEPEWGAEEICRFMFIQMKIVVDITILTFMFAVEVRRPL